MSYYEVRHIIGSDIRISGVVTIETNNGSTF